MNKNIFRSKSGMVLTLISATISSFAVLGGLFINLYNMETSSHYDVPASINDESDIDATEEKIEFFDESDNYIKNNKMDNIEEVEKNAFNAMFFAYEGKQKGSQIKMLILTVKNANEDYDDRNIKIKFLNKTYKESEFEDLKELIDSDEKYEVSCKENSEGIIDLIEINEL